MPKKREISREKEKLIEMLVRKEELVADVTNELEFSLPLIVLPNQWNSRKTGSVSVDLLKSS